MMAEFEGKTALVTGGTKGIGRAIVMDLLEVGFNVAFTARSEGDVAGLVQDLSGVGKGRVKGFAADVRDPAACQGAVEGVAESFGGLDVLVNNAGVGIFKPIQEMSLDDWHAQIDTNLNGVFNMTHNVWGGMRTRKFGRIVTISSINGQKGQFAQANYAATKAGDIGFTKSLAQEGARAGITVNIVAPGYINTEMMSTIPEKVMNEVILPQIPVGRLGEASEIARAVCFLASDDAGFVTGSTLSANGGQYMSQIRTTDKRKGRAGKARPFSRGVDL